MEKQDESACGWTDFGCDPVFVRLCATVRRLVAGGDGRLLPILATRTQLPERDDKDVAINNNDLQTPLTRYRLQVVDKKILKIIKDPDRPAFRDEHGKSIWQMKRDFTDKHQIISWR